MELKVIAAMQVAMDILDISELKRYCSIVCLPQHLKKCGSGCKIPIVKDLDRKCELLNADSNLVGGVRLLQDAAGPNIAINFGYVEHSDCAERKFESDITNVKVVSVSQVSSAFNSWSRKRKRSEYVEAAKRFKRLAK